MTKFVDRSSYLDKIHEPSGKDAEYWIRRLEKGLLHTKEKSLQTEPEVKMDI